jgi:hypothetical protein
VAAGVGDGDGAEVVVVLDVVDGADVDVVAAVTEVDGAGCLGFGLLWILCGWEVVDEEETVTVVAVDEVAEESPFFGCDCVWDDEGCFGCRGSATPGCEVMWIPITTSSTRTASAAAAFFRTDARVAPI